MNEVFLRSHGSSWCDPTLRLQYGETHVEVGSAQSFISEIQQFLESSWVDKPLVVKDPRIASLAKFWIEAAKRSEFEIKVIIPNRHPYEVAASLATRDGASADLSDVLWLKANFLAERASRALPRIFVNYADLLSDWRTQVKRIEAALGLDLGANDDTIDAFLDPGLHRHREIQRPQQAPMLPWVLPVYEAFSAAARDLPLNLSEMDAAFDAFSMNDGIFSAATIEANRITKTWGLFGGAQAPVGNEERLESLAELVETLTEERNRVMAEYSRQEAESNRIADVVAQRLLQWSAATIVPVTGPVVLERATRGFEPDGWMLKSASFTCKALSRVVRISIEGWLPGEGHSNVLVIRNGIETMRASLVPGQPFSVSMTVAREVSDPITLELSLEHSYSAIQQMQGSQDDRELGCIIQLITFA